MVTCNMFGCMLKDGLAPPTVLEVVVDEEAGSMQGGGAYLLCLFVCLLQVRSASWRFSPEAEGSRISRDIDDIINQSKSKFLYSTFQSKSMSFKVLHILIKRYTKTKENITTRRRDKPRLQPQHRTNDVKRHLSHYTTPELSNGQVSQPAGVSCSGVG